MTAIAAIFLAVILLASICASVVIIAGVISLIAASWRRKGR